MTIKFGCKCRPTNEGTRNHPREMLLPANMCEEHRLMHEAAHTASCIERAAARAAARADIDIIGEWDR
jgi:hypothetical protein